MKKLINMKRLLGVICLAALATGCATPRKPAVTMAPTFDPAAVDRIVVMPAVDLRRDKSLRTEYTGILTKAATAHLKKWKYKVQTEAFPPAALITDETLAAATPEWIAQVGPPDARWVMLLTVEHVTRFTSADSEGIAEVGGMLLNKADRSVAWHGVGKGTMRAGILFKGLVDNDAVRLAALDLMLSLPKRSQKPGVYPPAQDPRVPLQTPENMDIRIGMSRAEIETAFGATKNIKQYPGGETWIYHRNMGMAYVPFSAFHYVPDVWIFHFCEEGTLDKFHFVDKRRSKP
jgi:hypothetical protein